MRIFAIVIVLAQLFTSSGGGCKNTTEPSGDNSCKEETSKVVRHEEHAHITVTRTWVSPHTGRNWCKMWTCLIDDAGHLTDQELITVCEGEKS